MTTPSAPNLLRPAAWIILVDGVLLLLLGIVLVGDAFTDNPWVVQAGGGLLMLAGVAIGARLWLSHAQVPVSPLAWIAALAPFVLGLVLLLWAKEALAAFGVIVGISVLLWGVVSTAFALSHRPRGGWQLSLLVGLITLGAGIFMLTEPQIAAYLVLFLLGLDLIIRGADRVALGNTLRKAAGAADTPHDDDTQE